MISGHSAACDVCGVNEDFPYMSFPGIIREIQRMGWRVRKLHDSWKHFCPDCPVVKEI